MLDLHRLRMLLEFADRGTIGATAAALGYTPSAVSQQLAALEREAGATLLDRTARSAELTDAGRRLAIHAEIILAQVEAAEADLSAQAREPSGRVSVAAFPTAAGAFAPALVRSLRAHPGVTLLLRQTQRDEGMRGVRSGEVDVALVDDWTGGITDRAPTMLRLFPLLRGPPVLLVPRSHPLGDPAVPRALRGRAGHTRRVAPPGGAAHAAVAAAQLAAHGFTGPPTVLEGRFGFYRAWLHGKFDPAAITGGLGETWLVPDIFFKPYPANHFTHAAIDAAIELRSAGLAPGDVESATLGVAAPTGHTIGEPIEVKRAPRTGYMAQFSGPYAVAAGLLGGAGLGVGLADFTDELAVEPARRALMARVDVVADDRCSEVFPHQFPAVLRVRTKDSRELVAEVMANRGGPGWPLSYEELATKFRDNAGRLLDAATVTATERAVADLDHARSLDDLLEPLGQLPDRPAHG